MTAPAPIHRLFAVAWLISRAYSRNPVQAVAVMPWALFIVVPYVLRRAVYESDDRNGVVFFGRYRPILDVVLAILLTLVTMVVLTRLDDVSGGRLFALHVPLLVVIAFLAYGAAGILRGAGSLASVTGPETPSGDRYAMMALSQRPGTRLSALGLARRLIQGLPEGSVIVAAAADEALARRYERLGFTRGEGLRVYRVA